MSLNSKTQNLINYAKDNGILGIVKSFYGPLLKGKNDNSYNPFWNNNVDYVSKNNAQSLVGSNSTIQEFNNFNNASYLANGNNLKIGELANTGANSAGDSLLEYNAKQAEINRNWQEYMSNTSHQREVADLKAAGLNPILSANSGATGYVGSSADANTSMDIARLQAATALQQSRISAGAVVSAAALSNDAQKYYADRVNLPSFIAGLINRA